ncbi:pilus assembly protein TadG-related protein [Microbacterium sp. TS-1]|uniref:pilus assembly protein TadG-related protein n=1 Tax=Microbacterium sp. TS-1 TaxID=1344956 RepID=UPI00055B8389|nr:pilus assembly protein TadG-related protein [Microbacterium sp. TS-1]
MRRHHRLGDEGSVLPLTLGYALLAIVLVLLSADAMSLYLAHKRADTVADAAALAASDGFEFSVEQGSPRALLDPAGVRDLAAQVVAASGDVTLVDAATPDGVSARVTVATVWHPPVSSMFVPDGVRVEATATSRTVLR